MQKISYMVIVGDKEVEQNQLSIRKKGEGDIGNMTAEALAERMIAEINKKQ